MSDHDDQRPEVPTNGSAQNVPHMDAQTVHAAGHKNGRPEPPNVEAAGHEDGRPEPPNAEAAARTQAFHHVAPASQPGGFHTTASEQPHASHADGASSDGAPVKKRRHKRLATFGVAVAGGVIGAALLSGALYATGVIGQPTQVISNGSQQSITINPSDESTTLANAVSAKALPSVASINVTTDTAQGVGSGVVLDTDGHILTNYHVIDGVKTISVSLDGANYDGKVLGSDQSSDLAVIKIDPGSATLKPIEIGDSSQLHVGDWVMSVGSPFGLEQSVSTGIVSSLYRSTMLPSSSGNTIYTNLIQTDAAINPGNSGGALVDSQGKLIGINSIIESESGSSSGVGFAIPGNYATEVATKIINGETVTHAYIGGSFQSVNAQNARRNNLSVNQGAYAAEITSGGPADKAGIQKGDIIIGFGDEEITSSDAIVLAVRTHNVGDTVKVTLMRGSQKMTVDVTLGSDEELQAKQKSDSSSQDSLLEQYLRQRGYDSGSGKGPGSDGSSGLDNGLGLDYGNKSGSSRS